MLSNFSRCLLGLTAVSPLSTRCNWIWFAAARTIRVQQLKLHHLTSLFLLAPRWAGMTLFERCITWFIDFLPPLLVPP
eukprot:m.76592 g.76592  ORF g.76592 m.76592 type:complete len:78 (+) comp12490_c1_seq1:1717-1950(+)